MGVGCKIKKEIEIIIPIFLMLMAIIWPKKNKKWPSPGDWIFEYEDETWAKVLMIIVRIFTFGFSLFILIDLLFFKK